MQVGYSTDDVVPQAVHGVLMWAIDEGDAAEPSLRRVHRPEVWPRTPRCLHYDQVEYSNEHVTAEAMPGALSLEIAIGAVKYADNAKSDSPMHVINEHCSHPTGVVPPHGQQLARSWGCLRLA